MDAKVLIAPFSSLIICFLTTYFTTETTMIDALIVAVTTAVSVLLVNILVERAQRLKKARFEKYQAKTDKPL